MLWSCLLVLLIATFTAQALAQDDEATARARGLFEDGVARSDRGDWVGASESFGRAYALKPTSAVAFNYGCALMEVGRLLEAQELLANVQRDASARDDVKQQSAERLARITPRIAQLTLHVEAGPDASVALDGRAYPRARWDVPSPIDPGPHVLTLSQDARELERRALTAADGAQLALTLRAPQLEGHAAAPVPTPTTEARPPLYKSWLLWTAVGVVVVGGVVTASLLATRGDAHKEPIAGNATPGVLRW